MPGTNGNLLLWMLWGWIAGKNFLTFGDSGIPPDFSIHRTPTCHMAPTLGGNAIPMLPEIKHPLLSCNSHTGGVDATPGGVSLSIYWQSWRISPAEWAWNSISSKSNTNMGANCTAADCICNRVATDIYGGRGTFCSTRPSAWQERVCGKWWVVLGPKRHGSLDYRGWKWQQSIDWNLYGSWQTSQSWCAFQSKLTGLFGTLLTLKYLASNLAGHTHTHGCCLQ